ncbi:MAG: hydrogenase formation protein HypD [Burkholderiaceae bacterium]|nr:hydrogenase formation protein HypD [Burkholderiaceae bacterium]
MPRTAREWLARLQALPLRGRLRVMNVCGGHERAITMAGLRAVLPASIELIPGPGCPVCVCPEEDIHAAIRLALDSRLTLLAFGDMLRVPCNLPKGEPRSLEAARAAGARVLPVASPQQAAAIARESPDREVVFFAAGFETTTAPVASLVAEGLPPNLSILLSARRTWPVVSMLLDGGEPGFDALVAPGHVATVMGPEEWRFVPERHGIPAAIAGFTPQSLLAALYSVARQHLERRPFLDNCYRAVVRDGGNPGARDILASTLDIVDAPWRGIGPIPRSGFALKASFAGADARARHPIDADGARKRIGEMPPGCDCARVVLGRIRPNECVLYGRACKPRTPVGPCMVSDEGACRIWWTAGVREQATAHPAPAARS